MRFSLILKYNLILGLDLYCHLIGPNQTIFYNEILFFRAINNTQCFYFFQILYNSFYNFDIFLIGIFDQINNYGYNKDNINLDLLYSKYFLFENVLISFLFDLYDFFSLI